MSTMLTFHDNSLSTSFLTKEDIANICPMALKKAPTNPKISERYVMADTETVIDDLATLGWYPVEAKQCRTTKRSTGVRSFHMVAFQNPDVYITKTDNDGNATIEAFPRIILTNSHDGFNSFRFMIGFFRLVCSNGLIIATDQLADVYVRHVNYDFNELRQIVMKATEGAKEQAQVISDMESVVLTKEQKEELAIEALRIRKGKQEGEKMHVDLSTITDILTPKRKEDEGDTLWKVFNVLQESMMRGGYKAKATQSSKPRKARALTSVAKSVDFNKSLFRSAYRYTQPMVAEA